MGLRLASPTHKLRHSRYTVPCAECGASAVLSVPPGPIDSRSVELSMEQEVDEKGGS